MGKLYSTITIHTKRVSFCVGGGQGEMMYSGSNPITTSETRPRRTGEVVMHNGRP